MGTRVVQVVFPEQLAGVLPDQMGTVGPPLKELFVVKVLVDDDVKKSHDQGGIGSGSQSQVVL
jgi:hypothetical protein